MEGSGACFLLITETVPISILENIPQRDGEVPFGRCIELVFDLDSDAVARGIAFEIKGGGGTDFDCVFNYLKAEAIDPKRLVMFTDGYPWDSWGDANYCDTVFIIHGDKNPNPPFGTWALYEDES